jgi:cellulose synthase (UDP-forming)
MILFLLTLGMVLYQRIEVLSEVQLLSTAEITYGMLFFALIPFLMASAAMYAVWESGRLDVVSPWEMVDMSQNLLMTKEIKDK